MGEGGENISSHSAHMGGARASLGTRAGAERRTGIGQRGSRLQTATTHAVLISGMPGALEHPIGGLTLRVGLQDRRSTASCRGAPVAFYSPSSSFPWLWALGRLQGERGDVGEQKPLRYCARPVSLRSPLPMPVPRRGGEGRAASGPGASKEVEEEGWPGWREARFSSGLMGTSPAADRNLITSVQRCIRSSSSDDRLPSSTVFMARRAMSRAAPSRTESLMSAWKERRGIRAPYSPRQGGIERTTLSGSIKLERTFIGADVVYLFSRGAWLGLR
jgi:hypothetical protein